MFDSSSLNRNHYDWSLSTKATRLHRPISVRLSTTCNQGQWKNVKKLNKLIRTLTSQKSGVANIFLPSDNCLWIQLKLFRLISRKKILSQVAYEFQALRGRVETVATFFFQLVDCISTNEECFSHTICTLSSFSFNAFPCFCFCDSLHFPSQGKRRVWFSVIISYATDCLWLLFSKELDSRRQSSRIKQTLLFSHKLNSPPVVAFKTQLMKQHKW